MARECCSHLRSGFLLQDAPFSRQAQPHPFPGSPGCACLLGDSYHRAPPAEAWKPPAGLLWWAGLSTPLGVRLAHFLQLCWVTWVG